MQIKEIKKWNDAHAFILLLGGVFMLFFQSVTPLLLCGIISFGIYVFQQREFLSQYRPWGGYANWVTLFRMCLLIFVSFYYVLFSNFALSLLFITVVLLDIVDGYLARRFKLQSDFGLYFDMETDAFFVAVVSSILYLKGMAPQWLLFVGLLRYLNVAAYAIFKVKPKKEPKQRFASIIAGTFFTILSVAFILPATVRLIALSIISVLIVISFGKSILFYLRSDA